MTSEDFVAHVAGHAGVPADLAATATRIVLSAIGRCLTDARREELARELPPELQAALLQPIDSSVPLDERLLPVAHKLAHARELIASVFHVLGEELSRDALDWLRAALPPELRVTQPAREVGIEPHDLRDTLSRGRPGSHHPIGDARADRTQTSSIAADNPHGETKLSSTPGTTQERRHETLAEAHADPSRPLSTAKP